MSPVRSIPQIVALAFTSCTLFAQDVVLPDGKAKKLIENTCSECHGLEQIVNNPMSSESWRNTVKSMTRKGAKLTPDEIDTVVDYLTVYFAPDKVNVNSAGPKELQNALNLSEAEAAAILQFRKTNGNFKDIASLQRVPGVDAKKIEAKKDQIAF